MKSSSILMSSFGALLILVLVNENALKSTDVESYPIQTKSQIELLTVKYGAFSASISPIVSKDTYDFSYLKFNAVDFTTSENENSEMPETADFDFLKFNVSDYFNPEIGVLPEDSNFDYLKFDVNSYISNHYNNEDIPSTNLYYLKFDVHKFEQNDSISEINEQSEASNQ